MSALTDGLLTMAWQSSVLFVVVALVCRALRRAAPRLRHALWLLVLARLIVPAVPLGPGSGFDAQTEAWMTNPLRMVASTWEPTGEAILATVGNPTERRSGTAAGAAGSSGVPWPLVLQSAWLLGVLALGAALGLQLLRLHRIRRDARPAARDLRLRLDGLRARLGLRRDVDVRLTDALAGPVTTGVWRPTVLLPTALLTSLDADELDGVLLHELAHLRHHDLLVHGLATWARVVFWLHPVAWWTFRSIARERELAADEVALEHGHLQPARYGRTLLKVATRASTDRPLTAALAMGADARELAGRLRHLGAPRDTTRRWTFAPVALLLSVFVVQGCLSDEAAETPAPATPADAATPTLNGDVILERRVNLERELEALHIEEQQLAVRITTLRGELQSTPRTNARFAELAAELEQLQGDQLTVTIARATYEFQLNEFTPPQQVDLAQLDSTGGRHNTAWVCGNVLVLPDREIYGFPGDCTIDHDALAPLPERRDILRDTHEPRLELQVDADGALRLQGRRLTLAQLREELADTGSMVTVYANGQVPMARMVPIIQVLDAMNGSVTYGGVHLPPPLAEDLRRRLGALELDSHGGNVVIWADREARWEQHQAALQTLAGLGHARIQLAGVDANGLIRLVRHDLPTDVGVMPEEIVEQPPELIGEVVEQPPAEVVEEPVELIEEIVEQPPAELGEVLDEEVMDDGPANGR